MTDRTYNVLFLCTGNSARSILGEALVNYWGQSRFRGFSAGSNPTGKVHPLALRLLQQMNLPTNGLRSKSWEEFGQPDAPPMDFVFTVCDSAAAEVCPVWPGRPVTAHWGIPDPVAVVGDEVTRMQAFRLAFTQLERRVRSLVGLPIDSLDAVTLQLELVRIGGSKDRQSDRLDRGSLE